MATRSIRLNELAGSDNIARNYGKSKRNSDGTPSPAAFVLNLERPEPEDYLSNVWLQYFHQTCRRQQIDGVLDALGKKRPVAPKSRFAVFNILETLQRCADDGILVEVKPTGEEHDPSHTGIYGYVDYNDEVAHILSEQVNHEIYSSTGTKIGPDDLR